MRGAVLALATGALCVALHAGAAVAQGFMMPQGTLAPQGAAVRFDRPVFTTEGAALCPRQNQVAALRRALDDDDRAAFDRAASGSCKIVGPDIRLTVVARPGLYDPDVEVKVAGDALAPDGVALPRGKVWTLKTMVRN